MGRVGSPPHAALQVAKTLAQAAEFFMDGVNFDLEVPLQVGACSLIPIFADRDNRLTTIMQVLASTA